MVTRLDQQVGEIVALLKTLRLDNDTILIFSGDNGPQGPDEGSYNADFFNSAGGLRGIKRSLYEGGIREPTIIRWPGKIKAGAVSDLIWSHYDLFPTFADVAKTTVPKALDGVSVLPVWLYNRKIDRKYLYWEFHEGGFKQAVRMGNWKAVKQSLTGKIELYDLDKDAAETRNIADSNPQIVSEADSIMKREHRVSPLWGDNDK
jgi:arylsulfatase A-like enzyme